MAPKGWEAVIRNNLNGTFFMTREVATRAMIPRNAAASSTSPPWSPAASPA
jgi:NAD(P)-dependent dehydrogenase (short-subunit alcohol dehydrogenase family)